MNDDLKYKPQPMRREEYDALLTLIDYNRADELAHWQSVGQPTDGHVWNSIQLLNGYTSRCMVEKKPTNGTKQSAFAKENKDADN